MACNWLQHSHPLTMEVRLAKTHETATPATSAEIDIAPARHPHKPAKALAACSNST